MTKVQASHPYRKFGIGLGVAAALLFAGSLAIKRPVHPPIPQKSLPLAPADASPDRDAGPRQRATEDAWRVKTLFRTLRNLQANASAPDAGRDEAISELFDQLNDGPASIIPFKGSNLTLVKDDSCAGETGFSGNVAVYRNGKRVGYLNIGKNKADRWDSVGPSYNAILDSQGEVAGFKEISVTDMGMEKEDSPFLTKTGKRSDFLVDQADGEYYLYGRDSVAIGRFNFLTQKIEAMSGRETGDARDPMTQYLPIMSGPACPGNEPPEVSRFIKLESMGQLEDFDALIKEHDFWGQEQIDSESNW